MLGFIDYCETAAGAPKLRQERRCGGNFLVLDMGRGAQGVFAARRAASAAKKMRAQGVRRAVFPVDFPHTAIFLRHGIAPVDPMPLRKVLAPQYVRRRLDAIALAPTQAVVAVAGEHLSSEMMQTVQELALAYRYVMLSVRSGGEEAARNLRRQFGISLLLSPSRDQLDRADALVLFAPRADLSCRNSVLCTLYHGGGEQGRVPLQLSETIRGDIPPNCSIDQLAAALYHMGALSPLQLLGEFNC